MATNLENARRALQEHEAREPEQSHPKYWSWWSHRNKLVNELSWYEAEERNQQDDNPFAGWNQIPPENATTQDTTETGECRKCGRQRNLTSGLCGTCAHREARRINAKEMYGKGRRGY